MPHFGRVVIRIGCAEESGGGHGRLKGKYEENQISAIDAMPGRSRKRSGTVSVVTVFSSVFADSKDVDEKVSELSAASIEATGTNLFAINPRESNPPSEWVKKEPGFWKVQ